jgi:tRNA-specific adenosine deaminase 1
MSALDSVNLAPWAGDFAFKPFSVETTDLEFCYSRRSSNSEQSLMPSNISAVYSPHFQETLIGGVLQGRKPSDPRGASIMSRRNIWQAVADVASAMSLSQLVEVSNQVSYLEFKGTSLLTERRRVKLDVLETALKGWMKNSGDENFTLSIERLQK